MFDPTKWMPLAAVLLASCGYVGDPLPPALDIPRKITDFRTVERGNKIILEFDIPPLTTEGTALRLKSVELRAGAWEGATFDANAWETKTEPLEVGCAKPGPCRVERLSREWTGREMHFRVRAVSTKGRGGDWSDFAVLNVISPLESPAGLRVVALPQGVELSWQGRPGLSYRVFRTAESEKTATAVASVAGQTWTDTATEFGKSYQYTVEAFVKSGTAEVISQPSSPVQITPEDRFPPAVPSGLTVLVGSDSVELGWDRNTEADLRGYRLYRSTGGDQFERIANMIEIPSYSDRKIESGKKYRYAVSSVDQSGNESERSKPVEIAVP